MKYLFLIIYYILFVFCMNKTIPHNPMNSAIAQTMEMAKITCFPLIMSFQLKKSFTTHTWPSTSSNLYGCENGITVVTTPCKCWLCIRLGRRRSLGWPNSLTVFILLFPSPMISSRNTNGTFNILQRKYSIDTKREKY